MNKLSAISFVFLVILFLISVISGPGCANIIPPTGGPRDSLPPVLVKADPPDSTKGFKDRTITFTFDEFVELQSWRQQLIVSPTPKTDPELTSKLKTITIRIKDTLEPNTTYRYDFGNAIRDFNEGNVLENFSYIFTTGDVIDSLELRGNVVLAETGGIDSTLIVMLHRNGEDSAVMKEKPRYVAKLDGKGNFHFRFMPAGTYYIYALKDEGNTRRYTPGPQLFAFGGKPVEIKPNSSPVTLFAFAEKKETTTPSSTLSLTPNRGGGTNRPDERRLKFSTNLANNQQDLLSNFAFTFDVPLKNFDTAKLALSTDSAFTGVNDYSWQLDSLRKKITLNVKWKESTLYNIILDKEFAADTSGRKLLKTDTLSFFTRKQTDYGAVKINFSKADFTKNPVLQFIQGGQLVKSFPLSAAVFTQPLFLPGEYELRILYDSNKNGKWDPGDFFGKRKQPEIVKPVEKKVTIRTNWDNEFEIAL